MFFNIFLFCLKGYSEALKEQELRICCNFRIMKKKTKNKKNRAKPIYVATPTLARRQISIEQSVFITVINNDSSLFILASISHSIA